MPANTYVLSATVNQQPCDYLGFCLPFLPDSITDPSLIGNSDKEKVQEILNRWSQFIIGLRKWENCAFAIRYICNPQLGEIKVGLLIRIRQIPNQSRSNTVILQAEHDALLKAQNFAPVPIEEDELRSWLLPYQKEYSLIEIRQHEEMIRLWNTNSDAYVIHPFWQAGGSWLTIFETMLHQSEQSVLSIYLEPTILSSTERQGLIQAAQIAQTLADQEIRAYSDTTLRRRKDPQADLIGNIYSGLLKQLVDPFVLAIQVSSPDNSTAQSIARSIGAAITSEAQIQLLSKPDYQTILPTGFDLKIPVTQAEIKAAHLTFSFLNFSIWGNELATAEQKDDKARLAFLVGSQGAAAGFRFPVSIRGGIPGIKVRQTSPDFEPGPRPQEVSSGDLHLGNFRRGGNANIQIKDLNRHALITGFTGSGKTNTVLYLLQQLWAGQKTKKLAPIPFLVIEAAKKEYRGLIKLAGFEDTLIFTLGDETTSPFRLNPFELLPGVRLETHLGQLQNCFDAALPQFGILPSLIAEAMEILYRERGWKLTDIGVTSPQHLFPTLRDLQQKVVEIAESRGYAGELAQNIRAAASGRIGSLLRGSKGKMFSCQRSIPMDVLMKVPVILELNDLNQQDKSLTMMFLLMFLREYREQHKSSFLQHVTVVEEAHNVLENVKSVGTSEISADTRAKAVEAFAAMLAEVRAYGEGIIISDQSPEKLAPDAVRNTNLQIAHQLRHRVDREAIAAAMIMDEMQQEYLGKLGIGEAALFLTGLDHATFIQIPDFKQTVHFSELTDGDVREHMASFKIQYAPVFLPFDGCRYCHSQCQHRDMIEPVSQKKDLNESFLEAQRLFRKNRHPKQQAANWLQVAKVCELATAAANLPGVLDAGWCYLSHQVKFAFTEYMRLEYEKAQANLKKT